MESVVVKVQKKRIDEKEDKKDIKTVVLINTNLKELELNKGAIKNVYLFGCDIKQVVPISEEFNKVHVMRKARKIKDFQEKIKKYVANYYISGLVLMGEPKKIQENFEFSFYLKVKEINENEKTYEIVDKIEEEEKKDDDSSVKIYEFIFMQKKKLEDYKDLNINDGGGNSSGYSSCLTNYLNICLGKVLKQCGYRKDRTTRKILYYKEENVREAVPLNRDATLFYYSALKAVCETYDKGKIYLKLLPKKLLKSGYTYQDYFDDLYGHEHEQGKDFNSILKMFIDEIMYKRGIKTYNQEFTKIEDVKYANPYDLKFTDKDGNETNVGNYYNKIHKIKLANEKILLAVRYIDQGGKLKGDEIKKLFIPCYLLQIVGNIYNDRINVKDLVQKPDEKYFEIEDVNWELEKATENPEEKKDKNKLQNYLGQKFKQVNVDGQVINPPLIRFGNKDVTPSEKTGAFELLDTSPFSKSKELNNIDIYLLSLERENGEFIWYKLQEASQSLGISLPKKPNYYELKKEKKEKDFEEYLTLWLKDMNEKYSKDNKTDFILMLMDSHFKNNFYYKIFKSTINTFDWKIPTQVILYDDNKFNKSQNLSQFTNILCQMWAKKGNELYACNFDFIPNTLVIAYSSMVINVKNKRKMLTSLTISIGAKLYEYIFYSDITDIDEGGNIVISSRVSGALKNLLIKGLTGVGKHLKKKLKNIIIYRDAVNEKQIKLIEEVEISQIKEAIEAANEKLEEGKRYYEGTKWCLILVSKINEVKMFMDVGGGNNNPKIINIPVGTIVDQKITSHKNYDFYLNSAASNQGTCSSTHYTVIYDDTDLKAIQIYKVTYYLSYLSYNTTKSIKQPAPLYFVMRRNNFTRDNLKGEIINQKLRVLNISL